MRDVAGELKAGLEQAIRRVTALRMNAIRQATGLGRVAFANVVGTHENTIRRWDAGEGTPKPEDLDRLLEWLKSEEVRRNWIQVYRPLADDTEATAIYCVGPAQWLDPEDPEGGLESLLEGACDPTIPDAEWDARLRRSTPLDCKGLGGGLLPLKIWNASCETWPSALPADVKTHGFEAVVGALQRSVADPPAKLDSFRRVAAESLWKGSLEAVALGINPGCVVRGAMEELLRAISEHGDPDTFLEREA